MNGPHDPALFVPDGQAGARIVRDGNHKERDSLGGRCLIKKLTVQSNELSSVAWMRVANQASGPGGGSAVTSWASFTRRSWDARSDEMNGDEPGVPSTYSTQ